jgi:hypothetical protein
MLGTVLGIYVGADRLRRPRGDWRDVSLRLRARLLVQAPRPVALPLVLSVRAQDRPLIASFALVALRRARIRGV